MMSMSGQPAAPEPNELPEEAEDELVVEEPEPEELAARLPGAAQRLKQANARVIQLQMALEEAEQEQDEAQREVDHLVEQITTP